MDGLMGVRHWTPQEVREATEQGMRLQIQWGYHNLEYPEHCWCRAGYLTTAEGKLWVHYNREIVDDRVERNKAAARAMIHWEGKHGNPSGA